MHWNCHFGNPFFSITDDSALESAHQEGSLSFIDLEVEPISFRADLEFPIAVEFLRAALNEYLSDILRPQFITTAVGAFLGVNFPVSATETEEQAILRPEQPGFCLPLRIRILTAPIMAKSYRRSQIPCDGQRQAFLVKSGAEF